MHFNNQPRLSHQNVIQSCVSLPHHTPDLNCVIISSRKLQNINCILDPTQELGGLFLGDVISTLKQDLLNKHQIRAILTCMAEPIIRISSVVNNQKILPIRDIHEYPIINHFEEANEFIDKARTNKINVLVHCHAGVSRSASIVCAYLIKSKRWSPSQALEYVKQKRERAKPNISFWHQLNHYFTNLNKSTLLESKYDKESLILKENNVPGEQKIESTRKGLNQQESKEQKLDISQINKKQKFSLNIQRRRKIFDRQELLQSNEPSKIIETSQIMMTPIKRSNNVQTETRHHQQQLSSPFRVNLFNENKSSIVMKEYYAPNFSNQSIQNSKIFYTPQAQKYISRQGDLEKGSFIFYPYGNHSVINSP